ncbi:MAG: GerW family sporulation protein [Evtepia sp.]|uniref:GerW family sporulation protein n=1 Tax=Evtepia sp. TaxID=2773933 RepID=UPI002A7480FE|nr:GerW family sporulation protein [Evtepia sp.]MDY3014537.1 GerW family sporulation protein [Evtepia sp.]
MEKKHPVNDLMAATIEKIKEAVDANTVVGEPILAGEILLIPVSKISFGFGTGGSEMAGKGDQTPAVNPFGGGGGAGVKITPICFLSVHGSNVRVLPVGTTAETSLDRLVDLIPDTVNKLSDMLEKKKGKNENKG